MEVVLHFSDRKIGRQTIAMILLYCLLQREVDPSCLMGAVDGCTVIDLAEEGLGRRTHWAEEHWLERVEVDWG